MYEVLFFYYVFIDGSMKEETVCGTGSDVEKARKSADRQVETLRGFGHNIVLNKKRVGGFYGFTWVDCHGPEI